MLKKKGIPHQVLNAKQHAKEAQIVAKAGEKGMITIATNMAGRGTDIKLGEGVTELGGLKIIGTERHEARRIDNQLRGRSGRQGDVGESVFYVSLEDDIVVRFVKERLDALKSVNLSEDAAIDNRKIRDIVNTAQKGVESQHFETRKNLVKYDQVISTQREIIYDQRNELVDKEDISDNIKAMMNDVIEVEVEKHISGDNEGFSEEVKVLLIAMQDIMGLKDELNAEEFLLSKKKLIEKLYDMAEELYDKKVEALGESLNKMQKYILLKIVDRRWVDHIEAMENLKKYIGFQSYSQRDPAVMYQIEGSQIFDDMVYNLKKEAVKFIWYIKTEKPEQEAAAE
jgi:preprotein translocase subunit SecA